MRSLLLLLVLLVGCLPPIQPEEDASLTCILTRSGDSVTILVESMSPRDFVDLVVNSDQEIIHDAVGYHQGLILAVSPLGAEEPWETEIVAPGRVVARVTGFLEDGTPIVNRCSL